MNKNEKTEIKKLEKKIRQIDSGKYKELPKREKQLRDRLQFLKDKVS